MQLHTISIPPALGEATLLEWLVAVGESVTPTTPLARVLTAHAEWVIPAQYVGIVAEHVVAAGATIPVGGELARCTPLPRVRATPLARRLATALGVDLAALAGSGPGGRIMRADVVKAVDVASGSSDSLPPSAVVGDTAHARAVADATVGTNTSSATELRIVDAQPVPLAGATVAAVDVASNSSDSLPPPAVVGDTVHARAVADATVGTNTSSTIRLRIVDAQPAPLASATIAIDLQSVLHQCQVQNATFARYGLQATPQSALIAAAAGLFPEHPLINAAWTETAIVLRHRYHVAAGLTDGRWVLIRDAGDLNERGIARALTGTGHDLGMATCVIAVTADWWQITPPLPGTVAALTLSEAQLKPVALSDTTIAVGAVAHLSLCYDARVLDHPMAMAFLNALCRRLGVRPLAEPPEDEVGLVSSGIA